jgi:hypothetical protein
LNRNWGHGQYPAQGVSWINDTEKRGRRGVGKMKSSKNKKSQVKRRLQKERIKVVAKQRIRTAKEVLLPVRQDADINTFKTTEEIFERECK